jgi:hypothetical protein
MIYARVITLPNTTPSSPARDIDPARGRRHPAARMFHFIFPAANRYFGARAYQDKTGGGSSRTRGLSVSERGVYERVEDDRRHIICEQEDMLVMWLSSPI